VYRRPSRGNRTGPHPHPHRDLRKTLPRRSRQPAGATSHQGLFTSDRTGARQADRTAECGLSRGHWRARMPLQKGPALAAGFGTAAPTNEIADSTPARRRGPTKGAAPSRNPTSPTPATATRTPTPGTASTDASRPSCNAIGCPLRHPQQGTTPTPTNSMLMLGERKKRPVNTKPAQPRSPKGKRYGLPTARRRYHLPN
jgi:hypothetical protein